MPGARKFGELGVPVSDGNSQPAPLEQKARRPADTKTSQPQIPDRDSSRPAQPVPDE